MHVEQDEIGRLARDAAQSFLGRLSDINVNAVEIQGVAHLIQDHHRIVIDKQQSCHSTDPGTANMDASVRHSRYSNLWILARLDGMKDELNEGSRKSYSCLERARSVILSIRGDER